MIHVDRTAIPAPGDLGPAPSAAATEVAENTRRLSATPAEELQFKVYKRDAVRKAVEELFRHKCAYCEFKYAAGQPVDIEHFRPKAEVQHTRGGLSLRGYWWLAAEWTNLYAACIDCNRERYHEFAGGSHMRGKGSLFPLGATPCTSHSPGCEATEHPLLLDPCHDDPDLFLEWTDDGVVAPRLDTNGAELPEGRSSIDCYGLDRPGLWAARRDHARMVLASIKRLRRAEQRYAKDPACLPEVEEEMDLLWKYMSADSQYAGMARALVTRHYRPW